MPKSYGQNPVPAYRGRRYKDGDNPLNIKVRPYSEPSALIYSEATPPPAAPASPKPDDSEQQPPADDELVSD